MNEYPLGARTTADPAWHAESHALLKASVSSARPLPTAPKARTLKTATELWGAGEGAGGLEAGGCAAGKGSGGGAALVLAGGGALGRGSGGMELEFVEFVGLGGRAGSSGESAVGGRAMLWFR